MVTQADLNMLMERAAEKRVGPPPRVEVLEALLREARPYLRLTAMIATMAEPGHPAVALVAKIDAALGTADD